MYTYVFVRGDIPLADQQVQLFHVGIELGRAFPEASKETNVVVFRSKDLYSLLKVSELCMYMPVMTVLFSEPCNASGVNLGLTAIAIEPLEDNDPRRESFAKYKCWEAKPDEV